MAQTGFRQSNQGRGNHATRREGDAGDRWGSGIRRETALLFAREGAKVVVRRFHRRYCEYEAGESLKYGTLGV